MTGLYQLLKGRRRKGSLKKKGERGSGSEVGGRRIFGGGFVGVEGRGVTDERASRGRLSVPGTGVRTEASPRLGR